jgi:hypothetical protein
VTPAAGNPKPSPTVAPVSAQPKKLCEKTCNQDDCEKMCSQIGLTFQRSSTEQSSVTMPYSGCFVKTGGACFFGDFEGGPYKDSEIFMEGSRERLCCDELLT